MVHGSCLMRTRLGGCSHRWMRQGRNSPALLLLSKTASVMQSKLQSSLQDQKARLLLKARLCQVFPLSCFAPLTPLSVSCKAVVPQKITCIRIPTSSSASKQTDQRIINITLLSCCVYNSLKVSVMRLCFLGLLINLDIVKWSSR